MSYAVDLITVRRVGMSSDLFTEGRGSRERDRRVKKFNIFHKLL